MNPHSSKKRPLEEVSPNITCSPPKRRASFGFEMASIPTTTITNGYNESTVPSKMESKLPKLYTTANSSLSNSSQSSDLNDFQNRILSIQERLSRKPPVTTSTPFEYRKVTSNAGSNELQETLHSLNQECREKQHKLDHLTDELSKLRRIYRNYQQRVDTAMSEVSNVQARLDYMGEEIVKYVSNEEKLIEIKLNENKMKLENQFKEIEFEMVNELQEMKNFDYTELIGKIDVLKQVESELKEELKRQSELNDEVYEVEFDKLKQSFESNVKEVQQQENESNSDLEQVQKEFDKVTAEYQSISSKLGFQNHQVEALKEEIATIEETMNNYLSIKKETELKLSNVRQMLDEKTTKDKAEQEDFDAIYLEFSSLHDKVKKHDEHRRILENSIMEYLRKIRVYAITEKEEDKEYGNSFSKCFSQDTPFSFIIDEFSHLIKSVYHGTNVGIVCQYLPGDTIIIQAMKQLLQLQKQSTTWQFQLEYQAVAINHSIDLLTSSQFAQSSIFGSQKMRIDELERVSNIINGFDVAKDVIVHAISVNGVKQDKKFDSRIVVVDVSQVESDEQINVMQKLLTNEKLTYLDRSIDWISKNSVPLVVSKINDENVFNLLKTINSTNVACKKK
ncbi:hypothetical protein CANMA_000524 [Candida margitis]|uniref:uncharacterized protein n=1 Tax=Candida margitis TaxID=1775924 RepID=UPI002225EC74|nr:uncharacterized protein CANMA_000524 [Candida margitis]KAI5970361.1 hypothetical protein CANMA_000524 [Candida margitis]